MRRHISTAAGLSCAWLLWAAGAAAHGQLTDTGADFSTSAQGTNGYQYGYYSSGFGVTGTFSTANMNVSDGGWMGNDAALTPFLGQYEFDPGASTNDPAVREYTIGSGGQPDFTGTVEISGDFYASNPSETTSGFITVNGVNLYSHSVPSTGDAAFNVFATVAPGSTIDFGVNDNGSNGYSDATDMEATVTEIPEPLGATMIVAGGLLCLLSCRRPKLRSGA
jgi:hypothetical protein